MITIEVTYLLPNRLAELALAPGRRVTDYVTLLTWFKTYTPEDHADREDLTSAIKTLTGLDKLFKDVKDRAERERQLLSLQSKILKCPVSTRENCQNNELSKKPIFTLGYDV